MPIFYNQLNPLRLYIGKNLLGSRPVRSWSSVGKGYRLCSRLEERTTEEQAEQIQRTKIKLIIEARL